jgi:hypothetical protein
LTVPQLLALAWLSVLATGASAQPFGVPISDRVVRAELTLPDSQKATVEIREGTLLTVKNRELGYAFGLSPAIEADGHVELLVVEIYELERENEVTFMNQLALEIGTSNTLLTHIGDFEVLISGMYVGSFPQQPVVEPKRFRPRELEKQFGATSGGTCCVTCGPWTICGSSVRLSCGSCDSGGWAK